MQQNCWLAANGGPPEDKLWTQWSQYLPGAYPQGSRFSRGAWDSRWKTYCSGDGDLWNGAGLWDALPTSFLVGVYLKLLSPDDYYPVLLDTCTAMCFCMVHLPGTHSWMWLLNGSGKNSFLWKGSPGRTFLIYPDKLDHCFEPHMPTFFLICISSFLWKKKKTTKNPVRRI